MSNDWTNKLRERLADYQEPVKDDLWAAIEQSIAQDHPAGHVDGAFSKDVTAMSQKQAQARSVVLRRFSMAAAIAALAIGGTYVYLHPSEGEAPAEVASVMPKHIVDSSEANVLSSVRRSMLSAETQVRTKNAIRRNSPGESLLAKADALNPGISTQATPLVDSETNSQLSAEPAAIAVTETEPVQETPAKSKLLGSPRAESQKVQSTLASPHDDALAIAFFESENRRHSKNAGWSVKLYGENGLAASNGITDQPMMASSFPAPSGYLTSSDDATLCGYSESAGKVFDVNSFLMAGNLDYTENVKHHQPISVGAQVGYALTDRLQLTTGLVYTYTSSDFISSAGGSQVVTTQKLHYLGIPLNLGYEVWGTKNFRTYVTLGGEGAVNIKNQTETDGSETSSKRDRVQWSAHVAVGAQYDFIPQLGIYVEPGAKYYFDNGSQIENTFKDKKWNFNLQLGLRWNIK